MSAITSPVSVLDFLLCNLLVLCLNGAVYANESPPDDWNAAPSYGRHGMVVTVSPAASEVGVAILKEGGNAVDAAVATAFALAVTWPEAGNIGGGGFMLIHPGRGGEPICVDYREMAPAAATRDMFARREPNERLHQYRLIGVPGTVRGLALAHQRYGKLKWANLIAPAISLAREGIDVDRSLARSLNEGLEKSEEFPELRRVYGKDGGAEPWQPRDRLVQPELAATLKTIADQGADAFYTGAIADQIVTEMNAGGGLIAKEDLAAYEAKAREPIDGTYRGYHVFGPPPPSSGGIALVQMLNILEPFELRKRGRWSAETLHLMTEAMRRAYLDRARHLGDSDFVTIPDHLTSKEYAARLRNEIRDDRATASIELANGVTIISESDHTTHFSVVDAAGMAVSNTYTLEQSFGSRIVVRGAGFLLNNEMGDFNPRPGETTDQGQIGTEPNTAAPRKRMLSSMTPTIVTTPEGNPLLVTGSPGGRTIINTVLQVVLNVLEFEMTPEEAVAAPRFHHAWLPDEIRAEKGIFQDRPQLLDELTKRGQSIKVKSGAQGDAHTIFIDPKTGQYHGIADHRLGGAARGYGR